MDVLLTGLAVLGLGVGVDIDLAAWPVDHSTNIAYIKIKMSIVYRIGEILCIITMDLIRLPSPTGVTEQIWSTALPGWQLGGGGEQGPAAWPVRHGQAPPTFSKTRRSEGGR